LKTSAYKSANLSIDKQQSTSRISAFLLYLAVLVAVAFAEGEQRESGHGAQSQMTNPTDELSKAVIRLQAGVLAIICALIGRGAFGDDSEDSKSLNNIPHVLLSEAGGEPRPLGSLSFALNSYWGGSNPFGCHVVNLYLHKAIVWA
jgi:hypothetical protein